MGYLEDDEKEFSKLSKIIHFLFEKKGVSYLKKTTHRFFVTSVHFNPGFDWHSVAWSSDIWWHFHTTPNTEFQSRFDWFDRRNVYIPKDSRWILVGTKKPIFWLTHDSWSKYVWRREGNIHHLDVSKNRGTPKWMVYNGKLIKMDDLGVAHPSKYPPSRDVLMCFFDKKSEFGNCWYGAVFGIQNCKNHGGSYFEQNFCQVPSFDILGNPDQSEQNWLLESISHRIKPLTYRVSMSTLPPIIMEVKNGSHQYDLPFKHSHFSLPWYLGERVDHCESILREIVLGKLNAFWTLRSNMFGFGSIALMIRFGN